MDDDDTHMDEDVVPETAASTDATEFIPPSIDVPALLAGDSYNYFSPVPPPLLVSPESAGGSVPCVLGVDEAGRGPVLGPMVYGVFYAAAAEADALLRGQVTDDPDDPEADTYRFDDSKVLSAATRASLVAALCRPGSALQRRCGWAVAALSARDIGSGMLAPASAASGNLNAQAADATVALIRGVLARGVRVTDVFVDTVGPPATYQKKLERVFPGLRITVAKKADSLYPSVSAASVCAKVTRDVALEVLYRPYAHSRDNPGWGSGYPSDARCTAWLRRNMHPVFGWGAACRFSWGTAKDLLEDEKKNSSSSSAAVQVDWPLPDDETDGSARLTDFFVVGAASALTSAAGPATGDAADELDELGAWFGRPAELAAF